MDKYTLPDGYLSAGRDYDRSLKTLGLIPDGLLWAFDNTANEFVLVLVTPHVDHAGPLALSKLLFKAYNASATPKEISPFIVRIHSPAQPIVAELQKAHDWNLQVRSASGEDLEGKTVRISIDVADLTFKHKWVYHLRPKKLTPVGRSRQWQRFERSIEQIAA